MTQPKGFIALTSVVILSAVLVAIVAGAGLKSYYARFDALEAEYKDESAMLARSCAAIARMRIVRDDAYAGEENVSIADEACDIGEVSNDSAGKEFIVSAEFKKAVTMYRVSLDDSFVMTLEEIPSRGE